MAGPDVPLRRLAIGALALAGYAIHVAGSFFVFDDYALLGQATRVPLGEIVSGPLFGFYRRH